MVTGVGDAARNVVRGEGDAESDVEREGRLPLSDGRSGFRRGSGLFLDTGRAGLNGLLDGGGRGNQHPAGRQRKTEKSERDRRTHGQPISLCARSISRASGGFTSGAP